MTTPQAAHVAVLEALANDRALFAFSDVEVEALFAAIAALTASPQAAPSNDELDALWQQHAGHPADFAADVLERWGGWPTGTLGHGGTVSPQAAPGGESRFFIDHGVVHDRKTGKHVRCGCFPYEQTVEDFLALLRELELKAESWRLTAKTVSGAGTLTVDDIAEAVRDLGLASPQRAPDEMRAWLSDYADVLNDEGKANEAAKVRAALASGVGVSQNPSAKAQARGLPAHRFVADREPGRAIPGNSEDAELVPGEPFEMADALTEIAQALGCVNTLDDILHAIDKLAAAPAAQDQGEGNAR